MLDQRRAPVQRGKHLWRLRLLLLAYLALVAVVLWLSPGALGAFIGPMVLVLLTRRERQKAEQALAANQPNYLLEYDTSDGR